jgi:site-specific DNA-cytosine methylase
MSITENTPYLSTTKVPAVYRASGFSSYKEDTVATTLRANQQKQTDTDLVLPRIFTQNSRDEVRYVNGDGQLTGALAAHPGVKQQNYVTTHSDIAPTLNASGAGTSRPGGQGAEPGFYVGERPRRLTPRECERLQGFPDDWTRFADTGEEIADGPRYRMMGNAVTVNVAEFIGSQLKQVEDIDG